MANERVLILRELVKTVDHMDFDKLKRDAIEAIDAYNKAVEADRYADIKLAKSKATDAVDRYNVALVARDYADLLAGERPHLAAITKCYFKQVSFRSKVDRQTGLERGDLAESDEVIDLAELEDVAMRRLCPNGQWRYMLEALTRSLAWRATAEIGGDTAKFERSYKWSAESRACDIGDPAPTETSITSLTKSLQKIIDCIIFDPTAENPELNAYKALGKDIKFLQYTCFRRGKGALSVSMPKASTIQQRVTEVAHRIVTNASYSAEYDQIEAPAPAETPATPESAPVETSKKKPRRKAA